MVETFLWVTVKSLEVDLNEVQITPLIRDLGNPEITATIGALFVKEVVNQFAGDIPIWGAQGDVAPAAIVRRRRADRAVPSLDAPVRGRGRGRGDPDSAAG